MTKQIIILIFVSLTTLTSFGQASAKLITKLNTLSFERPPSVIDKFNSDKSKYSIVISIQQFEELSKLFKNDDNLLKDILPSIIALIVVLNSTLGAIYIGKRQISFQIKNGEEQLRSQESQAQEQLKVAREQIQESSITVLKQINSVNIQDWVIDIRNTISELITQSNLLNIEYQEKSLNMDKQKKIHEKFVYLKNKLYLLLKPDITKHKLFLDSLNELMSTLDNHLLNSKANNNPDWGIGFIPYDNGKLMIQADKVIENGRNIFYEEWEKTQSL